MTDTIAVKISAQENNNAEKKLGYSDILRTYLCVYRTFVCFMSFVTL